MADTVSKTNGGTFDNGITIDADGATVLTVDRATSDGTIIDVQKSGSTVGSIGYESSGFHINGEANHSGLSFQAPNVTPRYNGSITDDFVHLGSTSNRFKDLYLSGGVYLGGTGSANKLDDYEEGTFTPEFLASTNPTVTYSTQTGVYTKIGRVVHFLIRLATDSVSGGSGSLRIGNLPFAPSHVTFSGTLTANAWTGERPMKFRISGSSLFLYYRTSIHTNDFDNNSQVSDLNTASGGNNVTEVTGAYFTTA